MLAGCHNMIQHLSDGYDTQIGDGGASLSGGQRQRIGLARAIFGNPSLVVLDEPNANLDSAGEEALLKAVQALSEAGTAVIIISHKLNALAITTKILAMRDGAVQMFGGRDEVLAQMVGPRVVPSMPTPGFATPVPTSKASGAE
jgi:ATP-binding cassette subfamily C protein